MQTVTRVVKFFGLLALALTCLYGCGGGNTSQISESDKPTPAPVNVEIVDGELVPTEPGPSPTAEELALLPLVSAGGLQYADSNVAVRLNGEASAATGADIANTLWTQTQGPTVAIPSPDTPINLIVTPDVDETTQLVFQFTAQDSEGRVNAASVAIIVEPQSAFLRIIGGLVNESDRQAVFTIKLNQASPTPVAVSYQTESGTAESGIDFIPAIGELVFEIGETEKTVAVEMIADLEDEGYESFSLSATAIDGADVAFNSASMLIRNTPSSIAPGGEPPLAIIAGDSVISIGEGEDLVLNGSATDTEDGELPGTSLAWSSEFDGALGTGTQLVTSPLSTGAHLITLTATDSSGQQSSAQVRVLVGVENIAPEAATSASSTFSGYAPSRVNDGDTSTALGPGFSWSNDDNVVFPQWVILNWTEDRLITNIDVFTTEGYIIRDFDLEYWDGKSWVAMTSVTDNDQLISQHGLFSVMTNSIRALARRGSILQSTFARFNELVVYGQVPEPDTDQFPFTAEIGDESSLIKFGDAAIGYWWLRSNDPFCDTSDILRCSNGAIQQAGAGGTDPFLTIPLPSPSPPPSFYYWLQTPDLDTTSIALEVNVINSNENSFGALPLRRTDSSLVAFKDAIWLYGGRRSVPEAGDILYGDAWSSSEGQTWTLRNQTAFPDNFFAGQHTELDNQLYAVNDAELYRSADGLVWSQLESHEFGARRNAVVLPFDGSILVISGYDLTASSPVNDVLQYNVAAAAWGRLPNTDPFPAREGAAGAVFNGQMWVVGGVLPLGESTETTGVWWSDNGSSWQQTGFNIKFSGRQGHKLVEFNDRLWLLGGSDEINNYAGEIWSTTDGNIWTLETANASFFNPASNNSDISLEVVAFNDRLWLYTSSTNPFGETESAYWVSDDGVQWKRVYYNTLVFGDIALE